MKKYITFILDSFEAPEYKDHYFGDEVFCYSFIDTEHAIKEKLSDIWTYDISHLSFDLHFTDGYTIVIGYKGKFLEIKEGMSTANGKEIRRSHNLQRLLVGHAFDNDLGITDEYQHPFPSVEQIEAIRDFNEVCDSEAHHIWVQGHMDLN